MPKRDKIVDTKSPTIFSARLGLPERPRCECSGPRFLLRNPVDQRTERALANHVRLSSAAHRSSSTAAPLTTRFEWCEPPDCNLSRWGRHAFRTNSTLGGVAGISIGGFGVGSQMKSAFARHQSVTGT